LKKSAITKTSGVTYDKSSDSGKSANCNLYPKCDLSKFTSTDNGSRFRLVLH